MESAAKVTYLLVDPDEGLHQLDDDSGDDVEGDHVDEEEVREEEEQARDEAVRVDARPQQARHASRERKPVHGPEGVLLQGTWLTCQIPCATTAGFKAISRDTVLHTATAVRNIAVIGRSRLDRMLALSPHDSNACLHGVEAHPGLLRLEVDQSIEGPDIRLRADDRESISQKQRAQELPSKLRHHSRHAQHHAMHRLELQQNAHQRCHEEHSCRVVEPVLLVVIQSPREHYGDDKGHERRHRDDEREAPPALVIKVPRAVIVGGERPQSYDPVQRLPRAVCE
jgi:hypothetical protein